MLGLNSGLLGVRRVPSAGSASGLWVPNEQSLARQAGIWPTSISLRTARYFKLTNFAATSLNSNTLDFGEIELYDQAAKHTGITCTSNIAWTAGQNSYLVDGITSTATRSYNDNWSSIRPTATITLDLGVTKTVSHIKIFSLYAQPRFPASFDLQSSADNVTFVPIATVTIGTAFTDLGANSYSSDKVAI